jgi:hypothetical protein
MKKIEKNFISAGDAYENAYLKGTFHSRNYTNEKEFVIDNVTIKCDVGDFVKGEKLDRVFQFSEISDDGSCLELIITEPDRGDHFARICVVQSSVQ